MAATPTFHVHTAKPNCFSSVGQEPGVFDAIIVNDNLEDAYEQLKSSLIEVRTEPFQYFYVLNKKRRRLEKERVWTFIKGAILYLIYLTNVLT